MGTTPVPASTASRSIATGSTTKGTWLTCPAAEASATSNMPFACEVTIIANAPADANTLSSSAPTISGYPRSARPATSDVGEVARPRGRR